MSKTHKNQNKVEPGYILTSQEHMLSASGGAAIEAHIRPEDPYKPLGLLYEKYTLNEIRKARKYQKTSTGFRWFFKIPGVPAIRMAIPITLELLDDDGNTIRDPQPLNDDMSPMTNYEKTDKFPYPRK